MYAIISIIVIATIILIFTLANPFESSTKSDAGTFGKWPSYGGNSQNQQIAPKQANVKLTEHNVQNLSVHCIQTFSLGNQFVGYITVDDEDNAYITNGPNAFKINLTDCTNIWSVNVAQLIGYNTSNTQLLFRHVATLFKNTNGDKGIIFGAPSHRANGVSTFNPCYAVAINTLDGTLLWKTILGEGIENYNCKMNGFMVDGRYAYGGMAVSNARSGGNIIDVIRGKMFKLDTNNGKLINKWYSIDKDKFSFDKNTVNVSDPYIYRGVSMWHMSSVIDNYLITGTGNMWSYPKYIEDCLLGNIDALPLENSHSIDPCGNDKTHEKYWRCLERGVYPSSFIILNKNTLTIESAIPLQGIDVEQTFCRNDNTIAGCMRVQGPDADVSAVASYTNPNDGELYGITSQKSGHFYVFKIPSGEVVIAKKVGSWSFGGGSLWGVAVDEKHMIGIVSVTGENRQYSGQETSRNQNYKTILADGTELCGRCGSIHGIDLNTGNTIWQIMNPFGIINNCQDEIYDDYVDFAYSIVNDCERDVNGNRMKPPSETVVEGNVVRPHVQIDINGTVDVDARFVGPVTIAGDMVFIPSYSGHIFIHNLFNGSFIHTLQCPNKEFIKGGITVVEDRVLFYCGTTTIVSMKL